MTVLTLGDIKKEVDARRIGITPCPNFDIMGSSGEASIDLRLGRWFMALRQTRVPSFGIVGKKGVGTASQDQNQLSEARLTREYFVRFGEEFFLHPRRFVLGITLEWLSLPPDYCGHVTGKSSWGRRGLIIETAAGIHPGFNGCLTLELTNVGEVPIPLVPGMRICQIFFHKVSNPGNPSIGQFRGRRKPSVGEIFLDDVVKKLAASAEKNK